MPRALRFVCFLIGSLVFAGSMAGCGIVGGTSATKTPTNTATHTPTLTPTVTSTPTPTPTPVPPTPTPTPMPRSAAANDPYLADSMNLAQARTLIVRVPRNGAASASVLFLQHSATMLPDEGDFWVPIGASADTSVGAYPLTITTYDVAGAVVARQNATINVTPSSFPVENIDVPPDASQYLSPDEAVKEANLRTQTFKEFIPQKLWETPFIMPVTGGVTSPFGEARSYNNGPVGSHHSGLDIAVDEGTPVHAAATGRVAFAGFLYSRGNSVIIDHGLGVFTDYSHLSRIDVAVGQSVAQGVQVGLAGHTGLATGPHLHWELIIGGQNVDPTFWTYAGVAP